MTSKTNRGRFRILFLRHSSGPNRHFFAPHNFGSSKFAKFWNASCSRVFNAPIDGCGLCFISVPIGRRTNSARHCA